MVCYSVTTLPSWSFLLPGFPALGQPMVKPEAQINHHLVPFSQAFQSPYFTDKLTPPFEKSNKVFRCNICAYRVDRSDSLKRHMRLHTGNMFKCEECGMQYNSKHNLVTHQKKKHGNSSLVTGWSSFHEGWSNYEVVNLYVPWDCGLFPSVRVCVWLFCTVDCFLVCPYAEYLLFWSQNIIKSAFKFICTSNF